MRQFFMIHTFQIAYFPLYAGKNLRFFEYLRRNFYLRRSSKIFQNSEESSSSSSVYFPDPKILRLRLRSIFNLRCNTATEILHSKDKQYKFKVCQVSYLSLCSCWFSGANANQQKHQPCWHKRKETFFR